MHEASELTCSVSSYRLIIAILLQNSHTALILPFRYRKSYDFITVAIEIGFRFCTFDLFSPQGPLSKGVSYFILQVVDSRDYT
jgi:hypothetical protein